MLHDLVGWLEGIPDPGPISFEADTIWEWYLESCVRHHLSAHHGLGHLRRIEVKVKRLLGSGDDTLYLVGIRDSDFENWFTYSMSQVELDASITLPSGLDRDGCLGSVIGSFAIDYRLFIDRGGGTS